MYQRFQPSVAIFFDSDFDELKAGQWIRTATGDRGQYLGKTNSGVIVVRWQPGVFGAKRDTRNNATLRAYARDYGAK